MEHTGSMPSFLTSTFAILCVFVIGDHFYNTVCIRKIPQVYRIDVTTKPHTTPEHHVITLPPLPSLVDEDGGIAKSIMVIAIIFSYVSDKSANTAHQ